MPLQMIRNDISKMSADVIVNTANPKVRIGAGTDSAIYERAGKEKLLAAREKIGILQPGEVACTDAFDLDAKFIFHAVGPVWKGGSYGEAEIVRTCYEKSLQLAKKLSCGSIAFPLLATGSYGFPKEEAFQIALDSIRSFLEKEEMLVYLVVFDEESFRLSGKLFGEIDAFIDAHYVEKQAEAEYANPYQKPVDSDELQGFSVVAAVDEIARRASESAPSAAKPSPQTEKPKKPPGGKHGIVKRIEEGIERRIVERSIKRFSAPFSVSDNLPDLSLPDLEEEMFPSAQEMPVPEQVASPVIGSPTSRSLDEVIAQMEENFQERLFRLIDERELTDVQVYKKANIDRKLFSKIRCNPDYKPKKKTALALAIALELNLDETKDLLARAEYALSPGSKSDLIVEYFIQNRVYDIYTINLALFAHDQPALGVGD